MDGDQPRLAVSTPKAEQNERWVSATYIPQGHNGFPTTPQFYELQSYFDSPVAEPVYTHLEPLKAYKPTQRGVQPPQLSGELSSPDRSDSSASGPSFSSVSIEPDPLPPHSNPQFLSETQSQAFSASDRIPPVHVGKDEVSNASTGLAEFKISRRAGSRSTFSSNKNVLSVAKTSNGVIAGKIRFHIMSSSKIELTVRERHTAISHAGVVHRRWGFQSTINSLETWYWKRDKDTGGAMLENAKRHGHVIARMRGDLLHFEKATLSPEAYDEIVVSAIAMAEAARRHRRASDIADIAGAIGDFTSVGYSGTSGGGGGGVYGPS